jgi:hypothetical protein
LPDEAEEIPRPDTCSFLAEETDAGLSGPCHLCENPGGCEAEAEDSMAARSRGEGGEREPEITGEEPPRRWRS